MWKCQRDYCPHIHFKKCLNNRLKQIIPYTLFPDGTIDSFTNVHIRCANLYQSNIPTVAYQHYQSQYKQPEDDDRNFVKDYYIQNCPKDGVETMGNHIVSELQDEMETRNAYVLAEQQGAKYAAQQIKRNSTLDNARRRAISRYNQYITKQKIQSDHNKQENTKWLQKLYRKLEEVAKHIIEGVGESLGDAEKLFLLSKANLTPQYLSKIKVRNPKSAIEILEEIRTLMLKKKLKYQQQREQQQHNKSITTSFASQGSQDVSQGSMMSQATSMNQSRAGGEDQVVQKFCDFESLKKKWKIADVEQVKQIIRRILTKEKVSQAELQAVKKRKQAQKNNKIILSQNKKIQANSKFKQKAKLQKKQKQIVKKQIKSQPIFKQTLTKDQKEAKQALVKGGQFDAIGQILQRNRNQMFKKKQEQIMLDFSFKTSSNNNNTTLTLNNATINKSNLKDGLSTG